MFHAENDNALVQLSLKSLHCSLLGCPRKGIGDLSVEDERDDKNSTRNKTFNVNTCRLPRLDRLEQNGRGPLSNLRIWDRSAADKMRHTPRAAYLTEPSIYSYDAYWFQSGCSLHQCGEKCGVNEVLTQKFIPDPKHAIFPILGC